MVKGCTGVAGPPGCAVPLIEGEGLLGCPGRSLTLGSVEELLLTEEALWFADESLNWAVREFEGCLPVREWLSVCPPWT